MTTKQAEIVNLLLKINAVSINTQKKFWWTSGILSPIYIDNRVILNYPEERLIIENNLAELIKINYPGVTKIAGVATAGISHATLIAHLLNLPFCYVRVQPKEHGKKQAIEGVIENDDQIVIIEDLLSTGKSVIAVKNELEKTEAKVLGAASIFTYETQKAKINLRNANLNCISLTNSTSLLETLSSNKNFSPKEVQEVKLFLSYLKGR